MIANLNAMINVYNLVNLFLKIKTMDKESQLAHQIKLDKILLLLEGKYKILLINAIIF